MNLSKACLFFLAILVFGVIIAPANASARAKKPDNRVDVTGIVVDFDGRPQKLVRGECVNVARGDQHVWIAGWAYDDSGGFFLPVSDDRLHLKLAPGTYRIWSYTAKKHALTFQVPKGKKHVSIKVIGRSDNGLVFKILGPNGDPVANKEVNLATNWALGFKTDSNGVGVLTQCYGDDSARLDLILAIQGVGYTYVDAAYDDLFQKDPVIIRLQSGTFIFGKVVSQETGRPLGGVGVFPIRDDNGPGDKWMDWNYFYQNLEDPRVRLKTPYDPFVGRSHDGDGSFTLGPLPPGKYNLQFQTWEMDEVGSQAVELAAGQKNLDLTLKAEVPEGSVEFKGRVLSSTRAPLSNKDVAIKLWYDMTEAEKNTDSEPGAWDPIIRNTKTDGDGNFTLYPFMPNKYVIDVSCDGYSVRKKMSINAKTAAKTFVLKKRSCKS